MRITNKVIAAALSVMLVGTALTGCGTKNVDSGTSAGSGSEDKVYKIGISQFVQHEALDSAYEGFIEGLKEAGYEEGKNLSIDYQNAQGDQSNCATIASKLVNDRNDLILGIATPAAQAIASATSDIPVVVTAVTDPASADLVASNEAPGGNITGTSDLSPIKEQMNLLVQLVPEVNTIAMLYNSSEANSKIQVEIAKAAAEELGLTTVDATVSNTNEIQQVVQSLIGTADAIYAPTDNMIASAMQTVALVAQPAKIPIICGEENQVTNGGLATYGINYFNLGKLTGAQAARILEGEDPASMPIEYLADEDLVVVINKEVADDLGISIPEEFKDKVK